MDFHVGDQCENDAAIISSLLYLMDSNTEQRLNYTDEIAGDARTTESQDPSNIKKENLLREHDTSSDISSCKHERQVLIKENAKNFVLMKGIYPFQNLPQ